ncbi:MAG: S-formylglutathione hydrolase [Rhizobiales bacterium]|nr:S-formylglutathione hydrolase [Hyphomicrobiales bacterium]
MSLTQLSAIRSFGGMQKRFSHVSQACRCTMTFSIYLPPAAEKRQVPVLYWLSGLTCTDENFVQKAGAQAYAAQYGVAIVAPDTSPRGDGVADDAAGAYDFGLGAGFYVNATVEPFAQHYRMYDYIVTELPALINANFPVLADKASIFGHSMGGHGALAIALKNPGRYKSVSAFAPIVAPSVVPWGKKALSGYLGPDEAAWRAYDATALVAPAKERLPLLVDQGTADDFLAEQLQPERLAAACKDHGHPIMLRMQEGYDHSYFFIATFMQDHIAHHAAALQA